MALNPLYLEFTSEVDAVGRSHKGTLARAGYAVGACVCRCQSIRSGSRSTAADVRFGSKADIASGPRMSAFVRTTLFTRERS